jgi:hypothetical protein
VQPKKEETKMATKNSSKSRIKKGFHPRLDFWVTTNIIELAIPKDSAHCMIADALKAALPKARAIAVDLATIRYTDPGKGRRYIYLTPAIAQVALLKFDNGEKPEPFQVKAQAAQIVESLSVRKKRTNDARPSLKNQVSAANTDESALLDTLGRPFSKKRQSAKLIPNKDHKGAPPIKLGGNVPPMGALASGGPEYRTGRKRSFGLRTMGH